MGSVKITFKVDGVETTIDGEMNKTILDSAIENDIDAPYSCRGGACATCIGKLKSGTVELCLLYTSPSPRDAHESRMPSSA